SARVLPCEPTRPFLGPRDQGAVAVALQCYDAARHHRTRGDAGALRPRTDDPARRPRGRPPVAVLPWLRRGLGSLRGGIVGGGGLPPRRSALCDRSLGGGSRACDASCFGT